MGASAKLLHARADALLRRAARVQDPNLARNYRQLTLGFRRLADWADREVRWHEDRLPTEGQARDRGR
ncbi:MAG: hypothetical protein JO047_15370 [Alphaproteobacteria bacterium]|nr:hypothetical protein [Alphaproteobacteria bacterium]